MIAQDKAQELTLHLEGIDSDEGNLRLSVYAKKLDEFRILFDEAKHFVDKENCNDDLLVTNLSHNSPTATTIKSTGAMGAEALGLIVSTIKNANSKKYELVTDSTDFIEKLSGFCKTNFYQFKRIWFSSNGITLASVTRETVEFIDSLLEPKYTSIGEVKGVVEGYNSHSDKKYFYIYPLLGGRVKCNFPATKRHEAASAVEKNILVRGTLKYRHNSFFPYEVDVSEIEVLDSNEDLPKLRDVSGENNFNNLNSVESIKRIRDEW
ncbi:hypothetical protein [Nitrosomonas sp. Nm34]|uniref:hypothetical protein n=1 Tax=Nitrosomonas sp. Nm34 TaxID=1881055 RepID=UPI0008E9A10F|nr:hypothetical protein [Nitrosomonas sp. Nm34]SFI30923.1 hypothetical protein SAMN05428978_100538 [Nitrosomonas sp. Nm34]